MHYCVGCGEKLEDSQNTCHECGYTLENSKLKINKSAKPLKEKKKKGGLLEEESTFSEGESVKLKVLSEEKKSKNNRSIFIVAGIFAVVIIGFTAYTAGQNSRVSDKVAVSSEKEESSNKSYSNNETINNGLLEKEDSKNSLEKEDNENSLVDSKKEEKNQYFQGNYVIPSSADEKITFKTLNQYTAEELYIARNEMLARHGYIFTKYPKLQKYFESKSWYNPNPSYSGQLTSKLETDNYACIRAIEFLKASCKENPEIYSEYVFPNSDTVKITEEEVSRLNNWEIEVAKNEIYARYGLGFSTKELLDHFQNKSWFTINPSVGNDVELNNIEHQNVATILNEEKKRMDKFLNHDLEY